MKKRKVQTVDCVTKKVIPSHSANYSALKIRDEGVFSRNTKKTIFARQKGAETFFFVSS
jgi:hypothetical protein